MNIDISDASCKTPLHAACVEGKYEAVRALIKTGADVNCKGKDGITPLHLASRKGHIKVLKLLLLKGANVNVVSKNGDTSLHYAALRNKVEAAKTLLKKEIHKNMRNNNGQTAAEVAKEDGNYKMQDYIETFQVNTLRDASIDRKFEKYQKKLLHIERQGLALLIAQKHRHLKRITEQKLEASKELSVLEKKSNKVETAINIELIIIEQCKEKVKKLRPKAQQIKQEYASKMENATKIEMVIGSVVIDLQTLEAELKSRQTSYEDDEDERE